MTIGILGELFTALSMAAATVAGVSFFIAEKNTDLQKKAWETLAKTSFGIHAGSVLGIILTLFYMIYTHDYRYHYVWSHSSNELPVYYMISCFWEGQEGSFLLWTFWHAVLGMIFMRNNNEWRNYGMSVVASVQMILCTMILGAYYNATFVKIVYALVVILPAIFAWLQYQKQQKSPLAAHEAGFSSVFHLGTLMITLINLGLVFLNLTGFYGTAFTGFNAIIWGGVLLALCLYGIAFIVFWLKFPIRKHLPLVWTGVAAFSLLVVSILSELGAWKVGSTPFLPLNVVMKDAPIFQTDKDFIPSNGTGLNPLLQNYWMVIHPPTLFLGFASTLIPFAYVIAALIKGKYTEWIASARPWLLFSAMILGVGIIMGGYWAYETLNFGGYWNWDPVENASLVPWLTGVAALHTLLVYQKSKTNLRLSMVMIVATFLLVLYSTFLTRSGILGETSVHTFTDLGLSGQLLLLVFIYLVPVILLFALRWNDIPEKKTETPLWSAEFFLFLGALVFIFASAEISISTSLPVINKILGTSIAPPVKLQYFYYKWNVWFAVLFGVFSGLGQFVWWKNVKGKSLSDAIFRPFVVAAILGLGVIAYIAYAKISYDTMHFAYDTVFEDMLKAGGFINYLSYGLLAFTDELLLFSALFALVANLDILISFARGQNKGMKVMGGTLSHIGFALMLLGILFSSGYESIVSVNLNPEELAGFQDKEKQDNVLLPLNVQRLVPGYFVKYTGKLTAKLPIRELSVIEEAEDGFKVKFKDPSGEWFGLMLPRNVFVDKKHDTNAPSTLNKSLKGNIDLKYVQDFITQNISYLKPQLLNNRTIFHVEFVPTKDSTRKFVLSPESEINEQMGGILSHPSRKITLGSDIYTHVSSIPNPKEQEAGEPQYKNLDMKIGQTDTVGGYLVTLAQVVDMTGRPETKELVLAAGAVLKVQKDTATFTANPIYTIDKSRRPGMIEANLPEQGLKFAFVNIEPEAGIIRIQAEITPPVNDWIVLKAIEKPFINLLWLGTFILTAGFGLSMYRRLKEQK